MLGEGLGWWVLVEVDGFGLCGLHVAEGGGHGEEGVKEKARRSFERGVYEERKKEGLGRLQ